ncbi:MAG: DUF4296 domain-containing protein [bacterium]|jgi:hypothetical protein|nr:DUF4296 domain-containing protein [bacterium]
MHSIKLTGSIVLLTLALFLISYSCENKATKRILPENQFVQVYCDVVAYADIINDESRIAFMDSVLKNQNINREDLQRSVAYYSKDSKKWEKIFSKIVEELEKREKDFSAKKDTTLIEEPEHVPAVPYTE